MVSAGAAAGIPVGVTVGVGPRVAVAVGVGVTVGVGPRVAVAVGVGVTVGVGPRVAVAVGVGGGPGGPCWMQYSGRIKSQVLKLKNIHWPVVSPLAPIVPVSLASWEPQSTQSVVLSLSLQCCLSLSKRPVRAAGRCSHLY